MKKALITGITGQDGSYLAEFLLEKGYEVHGLIRRSSISNTGRIDHLIREDKIVLHGGDMTDSTSLVRIIGEVPPYAQPPESAARPVHLHLRHIPVPQSLPVHGSGRPDCRFHPV